MLNHGYIAQTLRRPLATKDGGTLRTLADAANYIIALPEDRRRSHWDRTCPTHPRYGGAIRDQPPARTRPVLRSTAQSQNAHLNIVISLSKLHSKQLRNSAF